MATETIYIRHTYTQEELLKIGQDMAQAASKKKAQEDTLKSVQSSIKADINAQDATINSCAEQLRTGYKMESHQCNVIYDHKKETVQYQDNETKKIVETRPMNEKEQLKLEEK
mgnify:CR=1 FL=1